MNLLDDHMVWMVGVLGLAIGVADEPEEETQGPLSKAPAHNPPRPPFDSNAHLSLQHTPATPPYGCLRSIPDGLLATPIPHCTFVG